MKKISEYKRPGKNGLSIYDGKDGKIDVVTFAIDGEFRTSPLSRPKVKQLISDLQGWLDKEVAE